MKKQVNLAVFVIALFSFFSTTATAQSPALDAAFQAKEADMEMSDSVSSVFKLAQYPDFVVEFEKKFATKWGTYETATLEKIAEAKTKKELSLIKTMAKTEFKTIVLFVFYELSKQADEIYQKNFDAQKDLSFKEKKQLMDDLAEAKKTITQLKQQKLDEVK